MKIEAPRSIKRVFKLALLPVALLFTANADALLLGEIRVNSALGQPLKAHIAFVDLSGVDVQQIKMRQASAEDYQSLGLQYPDACKFNFVLVNEPGGLLPVIRISTASPVADPFINLLLEVSSPAGRLIKAYTFLLDPSPDFAAGSETMLSQSAPPPSLALLPLHDKVGKAAELHPAHHPFQPARLRLASTERGAERGSQQMKLSLSLSISSADPAAQTGASRDVLQEELIAKEKSLADLKLQIDEMQTVIKSLEEKQGRTAVAVVPPTEPVVQLAALNPPVVDSSPRWTMNWLYANFALAALSLAGAALLYRKYKQSKAQQVGPFDDLYRTDQRNTDIKSPVAVDVQPQAALNVETTALPEAFFSREVAPKPPPDTALQWAAISQAALAFDSLSFDEVPAAAEQELLVPREYAFLMEAKRHLRAGNDVLAEEALIRAIGVNAKNLYGYQALLDIYETRKDTIQFENIARQLKEIADVVTFEDVAEKGHKLDPENPLYFA